MMEMTHTLTTYTLPKKYKMRVYNTDENYEIGGRAWSTAEIVLEFKTYDIKKLECIYVDYICIPNQVLTSMYKMITRKIYNKKTYQAAGNYPPLSYTFVSREYTHYIFEMIQKFNMTFEMSIENFIDMYDKILDVMSDLSKREYLNPGDLIVSKTVEYSQTRDLRFKYISNEYKNVYSNFPYIYIWKQLSYSSYFNHNSNYEKFIIWYKFMLDKNINCNISSGKYISIEINVQITTSNSDRLLSDPNYHKIMSKIILPSVPYSISKISDHYVHYIINFMQNNRHKMVDILHQIYIDNIQNLDIISFYKKNFGIETDLNQDQVLIYLFKEFEHFENKFYDNNYKSYGEIGSNSKGEFPLHYLRACDIIKR